MADCDLSEVRVPWGRYLVAICEGHVDDNELERASTEQGLKALVLRLARRPDPCEAALYLAYSREDADQGRVRLRKQHLQALLYATRSRQLSEALSLSKGGSIIVVVSGDPSRLEGVASRLGLSLGNVKEANCDPSSLQDLNSFRLQLLLG
ncbi:hypothetical protein [Acidilobus sp.]|uniref:hypothetical protein n=1 Tax=Acidilobus sp. TaxID=1872109 RepID=UPI003CFF397C